MCVFLQPESYRQLPLPPSHDVHYDFPLMQNFSDDMFSFVDSRDIVLVRIAWNHSPHLTKPSYAAIPQSASSHGRTKIITTWCGSASRQSGTCVRRRKVVCKRSSWRARSITYTRCATSSTLGACGSSSSMAIRCTSSWLRDTGTSSYRGCPA